MAAISAGKFIAEFNAEGKALAQPDAPPAHKKMFNTAPANLSNTPKTDDPYERGVTAGKAAAFAEIETKLEAERAYHTQQLELERYTWANREADKLAEQVGAGLHEIETNIASVAARILKPFLAENAHRRAIAELLEALETLIGQNQGMTLEIFGPADLLQLIREKLRDRNVAALFTPGEEVDVRVVAGQTILETSLNAWMDQLRKE